MYALFSNAMPKKGETPSEEAARRSKDGQRRAISEWSDQALAAAQSDTKFVREQFAMWDAENHQPSSDSIKNILCTHTLLLNLQALGNTVEWAKTNDKLAQIVQAEADEEGNFQLTVPRPGAWYLFAHGHAGTYDAFWGGVPGGFLIVEAGSAYTFKLSTPETACLAVE